jgi:hypothetical protein
MQFVLAVQLVPRGVSLFVRERFFAGEICRGIVRNRQKSWGLTRRKGFGSCGEGSGTKEDSSAGNALPTHGRMRSLSKDLMVFEAGIRPKT